MNKISILLSVRPMYAEKIFSGEKKIELRRKLPKYLKKGDLVIVYITSPKKKIYGAFTVKRILKDTPKKLWKIVHKKASVNWEDYCDYFSGSTIGYGLEVDACWCFTKPIALESIKKKYEKFNIPQSFRYIKENDHALLNYSHINH